MDDRNITFEDIKRANESIKTTTISRKDKKTGEITSKEYAEVNQRIKAFRMVYPTGAIITEMISNQNGICIFRAEVSDDGSLLGVGHAYEKESSSYINETSFIENCETSAVGRALGMAGFGINASVASAEEIKKSMMNENSDESQMDVKKATPKQIEYLKTKYIGENLEKLLKANDLEKLEDMPMSKASDLIIKLKGENK